MNDSLKKELVAIVGEANAIEDPNLSMPYGADATKLYYPPDLVLFPQNAQEMSQILILANRFRFPVVPRGAGTGMSGGAVPIGGGVVLSLERMDKILELDAKDGVCVVEPGVKTLQLQVKARELNMFYPPDPASSKECTIGGNLAECAGGLRAIKYGVTREYVLGLEAVLPTGDVITTGARTHKGVVGYDLTRLLVGSEGTLGILTKAILKLLPLPEAKATLLAAFEGVDKAMEYLFDVLGSGILPSAAEFMDRLSYWCVSDELNLLIPYDKPVLLIFEVDGRKFQVKKDLEILLGIAKRYGIVIAHAFDDEAEDIWNVRRELSPSMYKLKPNKLSEDIVVPRTKIVQMLSTIEQISENLDLPIPVFGHIGDGNLHVNIMYDANQEEEKQKIPLAVEGIFKEVIKLKGTISGEHGVGITKMPYLSMELSPKHIEVMKGIKKVFDPNNILNPHKIFPS